MRVPMHTVRAQTHIITAKNEVIFSSVLHYFLNTYVHTVEPGHPWAKNQWLNLKYRGGCFIEKQLCCLRLDLGLL